MRVVPGKSRHHVHARGLHSIVLKDAPGMVRLFVTDTSHELWRNEPDYVRSGAPMSVGFHGHHCDLRLTCIAGYVLHWVVGTAGAGPPLRLRQWRYRSQLRGESPGFDPIGPSELHTLFRVAMGPYWRVPMRATDLHTVAVPRGESSAWLVEEDAEDPAFVPITHSNADLSRFDFEGMYAPMEDAVAQAYLDRFADRLRGVGADRHGA